MKYRIPNDRVTLSRTCIFLLSGSALAFEVILIRLLSITRFHHLAFMVLSLALLGYATSGVVLAYLRQKLTNAFRIWFAVFAALFAVGAVACFQLSQRIQVYPGQWFWSPIESLQLVLLYLVLALPFFMAACGVGLAYCMKKAAAGWVYRADLLGGAAGSLGALAALWLPGAQSLWLPWCGGLTAAALMMLPDRKRTALGLMLLAVLGPAANAKLTTGPTGPMGLIPAMDLPLTASLSADGAQTMADVFTPLGRITVIRNPRAPHRLAPGLSLVCPHQVPGQWVAFTDGESLEALLPAAPRSNDLGYLDYLPEALAYHLSRPQRVLVLDTFASEHPLRALAQGATQVDVVMSNPGWRALLHQPAMAPVARHFAATPIRLTIGAPRGFLTDSRQRYDLIVMTQPALASLKADELHTVEALGLALSLLDTHGALTVSAPSDLPPRAGLRLIATAAAALRYGGIKAPEKHLVAIRSLRSLHLMVQKEPFTMEKINALGSFCRDRRFDPVWFPGMNEKEANQYNRIAAPLFFQGARHLLGPDADQYQKQYKFDVSPLFDDRPHFAHFLKLKTLNELVSLRAGGALGMMSYAEPILVATLLQAIILSLLVVWLPLRRFRATGTGVGQGCLYFLLGMGFMLVEYAILKKMGLFLNAPVLAAAVTLAGFLALAGVGGGLTTYYFRNHRPSLTHTGLAALVVGGLVLVYALGLPPGLAFLQGLALPLRMLLALLILTPLALAMGLPFPLALTVLKKDHLGTVPWAWGINGCGSLIGPVLGSGVAVYGGITFVLLAGAGCYLVVFAITTHSKLNIF